jgi:hypothetical protein
MRRAKLIIVIGHLHLDPSDVTEFLADIQVLGPKTSEWTRKALGWEPTGPGMIEDLNNMKF